jgi:hypothetical protein
MIETNEVLSRLTEIQLLIIKTAEVVVVIFICILSIRPHFKKLRRKPLSKERNRERRKKRQPKSPGLR